MTRPHPSGIDDLMLPSNELQELRALRYVCGGIGDKILNHHIRDPGHRFIWKYPIMAYATEHARGLGFRVARSARPLAIAIPDTDAGLPTNAPPPQQLTP